MRMTSTCSSARHDVYLDMESITKTNAKGLVLKVACMTLFLLYLLIFVIIKSVLRQPNESNFEVTLDRPAAAASSLPSN